MISHRAGLPRGPPPHRCQGGPEGAQAPEGHGELRLEHHRAQGTVVIIHTVLLLILHTPALPSCSQASASVERRYKYALVSSVSSFLWGPSYSLSRQRAREGRCTGSAAPPKAH